MTKSATGGHPDLKMVNPAAAAIDIGSTMHMAAVSPDACETPVRAFGTFTQDLHDLADRFDACGVTSVAMESIGVCWIPAFEVLETRGFHVILVNARYAKNVPRRKTDVSDAGWLRQLQSYGLLRGSFRPAAEIATLRAYLRQRGRLVEYAAAHIQHMQKALASAAIKCNDQWLINPVHKLCQLLDQGLAIQHIKWLPIGIFVVKSRFPNHKNRIFRKYLHFHTPSTRKDGLAMGDETG